MMNLLRTLLAALVGLASHLTGAVKRGRVFKYNPKVARWSELAAQAAADSDVDVPVSVMLAIVQVESEGNPKARRPGAQYAGLTQVGRDVAEETATSRELMWAGGEAGAREALVAFARWVRRYAHLHGYDPTLIAIGWKGGPGTLKAYKHKRTTRTTDRELEQWLDDDRWGTWHYVRKFKAALSIWSAPDPSKAPARRVV
jgi:hypothetical protein